MNRDKPRPFVLAATCEDPEAATLVYGSTQRTERLAGAAGIEIDAVRTGLNSNGLYTTTYFYPAILTLIDTGALPSPAGFLGKSLPALRTALRSALGIGRGSCRNTASPPGSRRGRLVVLTPPAARELGSAIALILTDHEYSRETRYHIIVPVVPGPRGEPGRHDVRVSNAEWFAVLKRPVESVLLPATLTLSIWHAQAIARETEYVVDDQTLAELDQRLCDYFSLPPLGTTG
ncbi:MAG TPA: hypothetical protein VEQ60_04830 [Longimicrobium sp.]|nr:hypothetical protein [Longimicrobium sp.]